jgi:hypothetical protein
MAAAKSLTPTHRRPRNFMTAPIPFPSKWVCCECRGNAYLPTGPGGALEPCKTCRPHEWCARCNGSGELVLGMDASDLTGGTLVIVSCPDCQPTEPDRYDLPAALLA